MKKIIITTSLLLALNIFSVEVLAESKEEYKTCKELNAVYKYGVKDKKETKNKVVNSKTKKASYTNSKATVNEKVYKDNIKLDSDKDGIVCEK